MDSHLHQLPLTIELETKRVLKKLTKAHQALAELKGVAASIPNQSILIDTLSLQEAKDSSAIENIITTHDDLYRSDVNARSFVTLGAKEVYNYVSALKLGFNRVISHGLLTSNDILDIQANIEENRAGYRRLPGTVLKDGLTGHTVYTPPQHYDDILKLMKNLEEFINDDALCDLDPLTKMAVIHHQFESIHPFYDGNGRTGRIINILYIVKHGLLRSPVLYLSRYINQNKTKYYNLLQHVRNENRWEEWLLYMLEGVEQTSHQTIYLIERMKELMQHHKDKIRTELPKIYSQDLLNNLFRHPYTKIEFLIAELGKHRNTAVKYLQDLERIGLLSKHKVGKENYYVNDALYALLMNLGQSGRENGSPTADVS